jgi:hypothetical protein
MLDARSRPRATPHALAGRTLRLVSTGIDTVFQLTVYFGVCSGRFLAEDEIADLCGLLPFAFFAVYEVGVGTSIGKQLLGLKVHFEYPGFRYRVYRAALKYSCLPFLIYPAMLFTGRRQGLHDKAGKSVVVQPNGWTAWARAAIGVLLSIYTMATFGCGPLVGVLMREKYDARLVDAQAERWTPTEESRGRRHRIWRQRASFELPVEIDGLPLRGTPYLYFYSRSTGSSIEEETVLVLPGSEAHLVFELCERGGPAMKWIFPCELSPREFQAAVFDATTKDRMFLSPKSLLRANALRLAKSTLLEGDELLFFRDWDGPEFSLVWHAIARLDDKGAMRHFVDYVNVGGDEAGEYYSISLIWQAGERREEVLSSLVRSFRFDRGSEKLGASLLEEGRTSRSSLHLLNAIEIAADKLPAAEAMYELYARVGSDFEKRQFATWVGYRVEEGDLRFMDLNEKAWDWRGEDEESR